MKRLIIAAVLLLAACAPSPPGSQVPGGDTNDGGIWSYAKGPSGENCLFYSEGSGETAVMAMACDRVGPAR